MAGRITQGPNAASLNDNFYGSFVTAADGKPALAVTNTDGTAISGGGGGGGAVTIADGANVTQGALADAAVTAGSTGSVSGKLRQISADISSVKTNTANILPSVTATPTFGQKTVNTTQVQITASSVPLNNGVVIKAPSTNAVNIEVGLTGVTATTGDILEPGESRGYAVNNLNLLYIISASSTTDIISYSAS